MNKIQTKYLNNYLDTLSSEQRRKHKNFTADYFCADEKNANICAELILRGEKTATCSMKYWYDSGLEPMPEVHNLQVVTDWQGQPMSIIEVTHVSECTFANVTPEFAASEGEGDKSLEWWHKTHWDFFSKECQKQNIRPSQNMVLILEKFRVVYS